jgi:membrane-bound lytic murein transglycosylase A
MKILLSVFLLIALAGCATQKGAPDTEAPLVLKQATFADIRGWKEDDFKGFMNAFASSCARIEKKNPQEAFSGDPAFGNYADWQSICLASKSVNANDLAAVRNFLEINFRPVQATAAGKKEGLFTGYYVSTLNGSRTRHGPYQYPLLVRPDDLVMVELGDFRKELKGQRIAGRVKDGKLKPFETRAEIVSGKLKDAKPLVWLDNPYDAFFVQVQGSGNVHLDDGSIMRIGYDGQNGHVYYAIGRELVKRGIYKKDEVSMDTIRSWMQQYPAQAEELMNTNPSYVFFREMPDDGKGGAAVGAEGVGLTPGRSLAVDHGKLPYGFPVFVAADYRDEAGSPFRRLMMAQDTGGAIKGAVRGDVFWGSGQVAEKMAGPMKAKGEYFFLLPK